MHFLHYSSCLNAKLTFCYHCPCPLNATLEAVYTALLLEFCQKHILAYFWKMPKKLSFFEISTSVVVPCPFLDDNKPGKNSSFEAPVQF